MGRASGADRTAEIASHPGRERIVALFIFMPHQEPTMTWEFRQTMPFG
jgi:hypothetical protein